MSDCMYKIQNHSNKESATAVIQAEYKSSNQILARIAEIFSDSSNLLALLQHPVGYELFHRYVAEVNVADDLNNLLLWKDLYEYLTVLSNTQTTQTELKESIMKRMIILDTDLAMNTDICNETEEENGNSTYSANSSPPKASTLTSLEISTAPASPNTTTSTLPSITADFSTLYRRIAAELHKKYYNSFIASDAYNNEFLTALQSLTDRLNEGSLNKQLCYNILNHNEKNETDPVEASRTALQSTRVTSANSVEAILEGFSGLDYKLVYQYPSTKATGIKVKSFYFISKKNKQGDNSNNVGSATIGRSPDNRIIIPSSDVSRFHARLEWNNKQLTYIDLGSTHGTKYINSPIAKKTLHLNDELTIGKDNNVRLRIENITPDDTAAIKKQEKCLIM
jgi:hypothetical protein